MPARANAEGTGSVVVGLFRQTLRGARQARCTAEINAGHTNDLIVELLDGGEIVQPASASNKVLPCSVCGQLRNLVKPGSLVTYSSHYSHKRECPPRVL